MEIRPIEKVINITIIHMRNNGEYFWRSSAVDGFQVDFRGIVNKMWTLLGYSGFKKMKIRN